MKRRDVLKSMAGLAAAVKAPEAVFAQQPAAAEASEDAVALPLSQVEEAGAPVARFFSDEEMATFKRLADVLAPRTRTPGAVDAGAPEFLDFYLAQSGPERQKLYREGLARLKEASDLEPLLQPFREPWSPVPPADPLEAFLRAAKDDLLRATFNSRAWAVASEGRRRSSGGTYWYPVEYASRITCGSTRRRPTPGGSRY